MINLTLDMLIKYLGEPVRQRGAEYEWQCPYCMDSHEDNLKFNEDKRILYCFANPEHSKEIIRNMLKNGENLSYKDDYEPNFSFDLNLFEVEQIKVIDQEKRFLNFVFDMERYNVELLDNKNLLEFLLQKRGIGKDTVKAVHLGYDSEHYRWVIPTIQYDTYFENSFLPRVVGFEYRPEDLNKKGLTREKGCPTCLAQINRYTDETQILTVVEGYFDGYALFQYLTEIGEIDLYHIVTPSNGVNGLIKQIDEIDFTKYKKFELFLDNDEAGQRVAGKILEKYPFFNRVELNCGCKDFNEHYLKCIKG